MPFIPPLATMAVVTKKPPEVGPRIGKVRVRSVPTSFGGQGEDVTIPEVPEEKIEKPAITLLLVIIGLFAVSSLFQTLAWYYNVDGRFAFWTGFAISMGFVVAEYLCMIPANQMGFKFYSVLQLGIIVELINWTVFILYIKYVRKEEITIRSWLGLLVMTIAVVILYA